MKTTAPIGFWNHPFGVARNNFKFKSLSCWSANPAVGCLHACRFCYVPEVSTRRLGPTLAPLGVADPDAQWGEYAFLRQWDRKHWRRSIAKAEATPVRELNADGNRAVMFSTTTDPFQVWKHSDPHERCRLQGQQTDMIADGLEDILARTTLNVRILTRSPLAREFFPLMKQFGNRLLFGMSIPTLNDRLARIYEPHAPAPSKRLETLKAAAVMGIPVYVAVAPVYPDCTPEDMRRTLESIAPLNPVTVFMEPLNIRAENVERIRKHAESVGASVKLDVFETPEKWLRYSWNSLKSALQIGSKLRLPMHLWPDSSMGTAKSISILADQIEVLSQSEIRQQLESCWNRISEWPGKASK